MQEELKNNGIELLEFAGKNYPNQAKIDGVRKWHKALLSQSDMPDGITNEELYVLFKESKSKQSVKPKFKIGQKVFVDTEKHTATCNISPVTIKQEAIISYYNIKKDRYCCDGINENFAEHQIKETN